MDTVLRIAVQKAGRLAAESVRIIGECGIKVATGNEALKVQADNFPVELCYFRDDDIPEYVADGVADAGIVGKNVVEEKARPVDLIEPLGFGRCRLSVALPRAVKYEQVKDLEGLRIATSYPRALGVFLEKQGVTASLHELSGSVEIAPSIGLSDAICDLVSTGSTLVKNGLKEVEVVMRSEAVLIAQPGLAPEKQKILQDLVFRIRSVQAAKSRKYIVLNAPNETLGEIQKLLPGVKAPSIMPLATEGWSAFHSMVNENDFWEVIEKLRELGAEGMLVLPIEKIIQ